MSAFLFEDYQKEIYSLFEYENYSDLIKRLIDITLDTEDIQFYKKTVDLLNWLDNKENDPQQIKDRIRTLLDEIFSVLLQKPVQREGKLLEVSGLVKKYAKGRFTLGPVSFSINLGEIIGLVGENGNGKTTLLRALCGELAPTSGQINYNFDFKNKYDLRTKLIYIPQRTTDWYGSLLSNLRFTAASYGIRGNENELLTELVVARMGLRKHRTQTWKGLSSGYKMRFELARMLLRRPQLLLIDEPLANLDILAQQVVLDDFRNIAKSPFRPLGIVLSSQQLYEVEKTSDQVIFLKNGIPNNEIKRKEGMVEFAEVEKLIIEFESNCDQEQLREAFKDLNLESIQLKGGTYIAVFPQDTPQGKFLQLIVDKGIPLNYFRDISNSTRRFFLS